MEGLMDMDLTKKVLEEAKIEPMKVLDETKKPEAKVTHVGLKEVNLEYITYNAKVSVTNPYSVPIPIFQITYSLKSADRELVSGTSPEPEALKANETTVLELEMKVSFKWLLSLARDIGADWDIDYDMGINIVVNVPLTGEITIPISNKGELKLPTFKDLAALANPPNLNKVINIFK